MTTRMGLTFIMRNVFFMQQPPQNDHGRNEQLPIHQYKANS